MYLLHCRQYKIWDFPRLCGFDTLIKFIIIIIIIIALLMYTYLPHFALI